MANIEYSEHRCDSNDRQFYIGFSDISRKNTKSLSVDNSGAGIAVSMENVNTVVKRQHIKQIGYQIESEVQGVLFVEFNSRILLSSIVRSDKIEFGTVSYDCWHRLVLKVGDVIPTIVKKMD